MAEVKNLRQKLQEARMLLKKEDIKKSGRNSFLNTQYYTLGDIQTPITKVCNEVRICPVITFTKEMATMTIYDFDSDETLVFTSPMCEIVKDDNKKKSMVQELGALETYSRRFLYLAIFEIIESDEEESDSIEMHNILMVKTRIERTMTQLLTKGYDMPEILKEIGVKDEKNYNQYLNFCNSINTLEKNMKVLLNKEK